MTKRRKKILFMFQRWRVLLSVFGSKGDFVEHFENTWHDFKVKLDSLDPQNISIPSSLSPQPLTNLRLPSIKRSIAQVAAIFVHVLLKRRTIKSHSINYFAPRAYTSNIWECKPIKAMKTSESGDELKTIRFSRRLSGCVCSTFELRLFLLLTASRDWDGIGRN